MYFTINAAEGGFRAYIRGDNSEIVFWTEVYTTKAAAKNAIRLVKDEAADAPVYDRTIKD